MVRPTVLILVLALASAHLVAANKYEVDATPKVDYTAPEEGFQVLPSANSVTVDCSQFVKVTLNLFNLIKQESLKYRNGGFSKVQLYAHEYKIVVLGQMLGDLAKHQKDPRKGVVSVCGESTFPGIRDYAITIRRMIAHAMEPSILTLPNVDMKLVHLWSALYEDEHSHEPDMVSFETCLHKLYDKCKRNMMPGAGAGDVNSLGSYHPRKETPSRIKEKYGYDEDGMGGQTLVEADLQATWVKEVAIALGRVVDYVTNIDPKLPWAVDDYYCAAARHLLPVGQVWFSTVATGVDYTRPTMYQLRTALEHYVTFSPKSSPPAKPLIIWQSTFADDKFQTRVLQDAQYARNVLRQMDDWRVTLAKQQGVEVPLRYAQFLPS